MAMRRAALINMDGQRRPEHDDGPATPLRGTAQGVSGTTFDSPERGAPGSDLDTTTRLDPVVTFETQAGDFAIEFNVSSSPLGVASVVDLARTGFFEGILLHRIVRGHGVQFGCPFTKSHPARRDLFGRGGPPAHTEFPSATSPATYVRDRCGNVPDEHLDHATNAAKTVCLASAPGEKDSRGSQLFVNLADNGYLDWHDTRLPETQFIVIGKVVRGWHVFTQLEAVEVDADDVPIAPIRILRTSVANDPVDLFAAASEAAVVDAAATAV
jgi:cyclophilin family peptidyl-prolyl cis-trans isomerase